MQDRPSRELARQWDARDPLARFRKQFSRPAGQIYFQGGSLGLCAQEAERSLLRALADWKGKAHEGAASSALLGEGISRRLAGMLGASPDEVGLASSTALSLSQLLARLYRRQFHRPRILIDAFCSATFSGLLRSHLELRGLDGERELQVVQPNEAWLLDEAGIEAALADPMLQMAILPVVVRATGQRLDVARLVRAARQRGVIIGLDLSSSLGVIPHALVEWDLDFAIWEHGNFANGGPNTASGLFLSRRYFDPAEEMQPWLTAECSGEAAAALQIGPASFFSLAPLDGALRLLEEAGPERLRSKSLDLTQLLRCALEAEIPTLDLLTPREAEQRGGHLAIYHPGAREICEALCARGVSADCCAPGVLCFAPSPLYNSFVECWDAVQILRRVLEANAEAACVAPRELVS